MSSSLSKLPMIALTPSALSFSALSSPRVSAVIVYLFVSSSDCRSEPPMLQACSDVSFDVGERNSMAAHNPTPSMKTEVLVVVIAC